MLSKKLTKADAFIIIAAVLAALLLLSSKLFTSGEDMSLSVICDSGEYSYSLDENRKIELISGGIRVNIVIKNGSAYIESSECPNKICMRGAAAKDAGDSVVCAPARLALIIKDGGGEENADAYAG